MPLDLKQTEKYSADDTRNETEVCLKNKYGAPNRCNTANSPAVNLRYCVV